MIPMLNGCLKGSKILFNNNNKNNDINCSACFFFFLLNSHSTIRKSSFVSLLDLRQNTYSHIHKGIYSIYFVFFFCCCRRLFSTSDSKQEKKIHNNFVHSILVQWDISNYICFLTPSECKHGELAKLYNYVEALGSETKKPLRRRQTTTKSLSKEIL